MNGFVLVCGQGSRLPLPIKRGGARRTTKFITNP
jgi:hypothetical protein